MSTSEAEARAQLVAGTSDLVSQARAGDARAREELVLRYRAPLARFLHARLTDSARGLSETDDIVQEALAAAVLRLDRFEYRGIGSFWSYLRAIGVNLVRRAVRRSSLRRDERDLEDSHDAPEARGTSPLSALLDSERSAQFEAAVAELAQPAREALLLRIELDLPYQAIADECGYPTADAARMAVCRATERVANAIARADRGAP